MDRRVERPFTTLFPALSLLAIIGFAPLFFTVGISRLTAPTRELAARLDRLERSLLDRVEALAQQAWTSKNGIISEGEEHQLLLEIDELASTSRMEVLRDLLAEYLEKFGQSPNSTLVRKMQDELAFIGKTAPDAGAIEEVFQGPAAARLDGQGTKVLLFWEVWCPHCRREAPRMQELYLALRDRGLEVVGLTKVSGLATDEQVRAFIKEQGIEYPMVKEDGSASQQLGVTGVPAAAVISNGVVIWRGHPARLSRELLMEWL